MTRRVEDPERVREEHAVEHLELRCRARRRASSRRSRRSRRPTGRPPRRTARRRTRSRRARGGARRCGAWRGATPRSTPSASASAVGRRRPTCDGVRERARGRTRCSAVRAACRRTFAPRFARGSRPIATWSSSSGLEPGVLEAPARRERREAGAVLDAVEALLLGGRDELAVDDERRRGVAVVRVEAEDRGHGRDRSQARRRTGPLSEPPRARRSTARGLRSERRLLPNRRASRSRGGRSAGYDLGCCPDPRGSGRTRGWPRARAVRGAR